MEFWEWKRTDQSLGRRSELSLTKLRQGSVGCMCRVGVVVVASVDVRYRLACFRRISLIRCEFGRCSVVSRQESAIVVDCSGLSSVGAVSKWWTEATIQRGNQEMEMEHGVEGVSGDLGWKPIRWGIGGGNGRMQGRQVRQHRGGQSLPESGLQNGCRAPDGKFHGCQVEATGGHRQSFRDLRGQVIRLGHRTICCRKADRSLMYPRVYQTIITQIGSM